ncbi:MAG: hypothetical protein ABIH67_04115 [Candidatus Uhrbacteria bacterium]
MSTMTLRYYNSTVAFVDRPARRMEKARIQARTKLSRRRFRQTVRSLLSRT